MCVCESNCCSCVYFAKSANFGHVEMADHMVVSINVKAGVCWVQTMVICQNVKKCKKDEVCVPGVRGLWIRG